MNELIQQLLEKVQHGELSDTEAEQQYQQLINQQVSEETIATVTWLDKTYQEQENDLPSLPNKISYTQRIIEVIKVVEKPEFRLFIFLPFGFGNDTVSWSWRNSFEDNDNVEVWLIGASNISDWQQLTTCLVKQMLPLCDLPFIVYGHSMGGIVAYETVVALEQQHQISPLVFIPSSVAPPGIFERLKVLPPIYDMDDEMDMPTCRNLLEKSQIILPLQSGVKPLPDDAIQCDIELIKTYRSQHVGTPLSCSILALQANNDILVKDPVTLSLWQDYTKGQFQFKEVEGTHLYFMNPPQSLFTTIKSFLQPEKSSSQPTFEPKTYRLISFETGTEEVNVYPYGIKPKGYLIYQPDGKMAAHLWSSSRLTCHSCDILNDNDPIEKMLTYLSYSGDYDVKQGVIEHTVAVSTDPNFVNDNLIRYYSIDKQHLTMVTAPLTTKHHKQSKSSTHSRLVWEEVEQDINYIGHPIVGSWVLQAYQEENEQQDLVLGESPEGVLILTPEGYFSMIAIRKQRSRPQYDNLVLATNDELLDAMHSCRSYCGRFEIDDNNITLLVEEGLFEGAPGKIQMQYQCTAQCLNLYWTWDEPNTKSQHNITQTWVKHTALANKK
ncbi:MAG: lipocalin-like domain-containing protein [Methylococcaceae bacterium]